MRFYTIFLAIACFLLVSCEDDPLSPQIVVEVKAYDLDNNSNGSDIRVDFRVINNQDVREYRVMIIPAKDSSSFTLNNASSNTSYYRIEPVSFQLNYSVNRLPAGFLDVNGATITNGVTYVSVVFVEKNSEYQLSGFSKPVTLIDQDPYIGIYSISWSWHHNHPGGNRDFRNLPDNGIIDLTISVEKYRGEIQCEGCFVGNWPPINNYGFLEFSIIEANILNFTFEWSIQPCWWNVICEDQDCPLTMSGQGRLINEVVIEVSTTGTDCLATYNDNSKFFLSKQ